MRRELTIASAGLLAAGMGLISCQPQNDEINKKLDAISKKIDDLSAKVQQGARPQMPQPPPGPDPNAIYAVPIDGSAIAGPKNAKITIVEAFEFA